MIEARPTFAVRTTRFTRDTLVAMISCTLGAPVGYWGFLVLYALQTGNLPRPDDILPPPVMFLFGVVIGAVFGIGVRASVGAIRRQRVWAFGFFIAGIVVTPIMLVALAAYAMSGRPY